MPSEKSVARSGSEADAMRMISTCFARVLQRNTCSLDMHFLLIFQEVVSISKTCNQLAIMALMYGTCHSLFLLADICAPECLSFETGAQAREEKLNGTLGWYVRVCLVRQRREKVGWYLPDRAATVHAGSPERGGFSPP